MSPIQTEAMLIANDMNQTQNVSKALVLDPMLIISIVGLIVDIVKAYIECQQSASQAQSSMTDPGLIERWRLRRAIRSHIDDSEVQEAIGQQLFQSTLNVSKTLTVQNVTDMFAEVAANPNMTLSVKEAMKLTKGNNE
jgi:hypothetical protein